MQFDITNNLKVEETVRPSVATSNVTGEEVDLRGCDSVMFAATVGAITGAAGDGAVTLEESDTSGSGYTAVASTDILGTAPTALAANTAYQFGYRGNKRYIRAILDIGGETNIAGSVVAVKGHLHRAPDGN